MYLCIAAAMEDRIAEERQKNAQAMAPLAAKRPLRVTGLEALNISAARPGELVRNFFLVIGYINLGTFR
jgi:hypothetical protein